MKKQNSMFEPRYIKLFLLTVFLLMQKNPILSRSIGSLSSAKNDSLQAEGGLAGLGEKVFDWITWEQKGYVFTIYPSISVSPRNGFAYGVMPAVKWDSSREGMFNTIAVNADIFPSFWVGGGILINKNRFDETAAEVFKRDGLLGAEGGWLLGIGPNMVFDTRHRTLSPQRGIWIQVLPLFAGLGDYDYQKITLDGRKYFRLRDESTTLAFQAIVDYATEGVPFFEEPQLGGKERLRGIGHPMHETGNAVWLARAEIRQHLWWRLGVVAFAGLGGAGDHFKEPFADVISSLGGGLRFRMLPDDPLNVRFDFGVSSTGQSGFFISLKEAF
jgi:hypothetical protein